MSEDLDGKQRVHFQPAWTASGQEAFPSCDCTIHGEKKAKALLLTVLMPLRCSTGIVSCVQPETLLQPLSTPRVKDPKI